MSFINVLGLIRESNPWKNVHHVSPLRRSQCNIASSDERKHSVLVLKLVGLHYEILVISASPFLKVSLSPFWDLCDRILTRPSARRRFAFHRCSASFATKWRKGMMISWLLFPVVLCIASTSSMHLGEISYGHRNSYSSSGLCLRG